MTAKGREVPARKNDGTETNIVVVIVGPLVLLAKSVVRSVCQLVPLATAQATEPYNVDRVPVGGEHHLDRSRAVEEATDVAPKVLGRRGDVDPLGEKDKGYRYTFV